MDIGHGYDVTADVLQLDHDADVGSGDAVPDLILQIIANGGFLLIIQ